MFKKLAPPVRRSAPSHNPAIESWLDTVPPCSTSPPPEELRQWRLDKGWRETWLITSVALRTSSAVLALVVFIITLVMLQVDSAEMDLALEIPPLVVVRPLRPDRGGRQPADSVDGKVPSGGSLGCR